MKNLDLAPVGSSYELDYGQIPDKKMKRKKKKYIKQKNELSDSDDSSTESPKPLDPRPILGNRVPNVFVRAIRDTNEIVINIRIIILLFVMF